MLVADSCDVDDSNREALIVLYHARLPWSHCRTLVCGVLGQLWCMQHLLCQVNGTGSLSESGVHAKGGLAETNFKLPPCR